MYDCLYSRYIARNEPGKRYRILISHSAMRERAGTLIILVTEFEFEI